MSHYRHLAAVYDDWNLQANYDRWVDFIVRSIRAHTSGSRVLDVCCGTGTIMGRLAAAGFETVGVDASPEMLAVARDRLGPQAILHEMVVPGNRVLADTFDAAICTFDSINYFTAPRALADGLKWIAGHLADGGLLIFDINTRRKLEEILGNSHWGDDLGSFAYVWRNRLSVETCSVEFLITLFRRTEQERFERFEERHVQRWFEDDDVIDGAARAGLDVVGVWDDYSDTPASDATMRASWVLQKRPGQ